jgi:hypothetical protein
VSQSCREVRPEGEQVDEGGFHDDAKARRRRRSAQRLPGIDFIKLPFRTENVFILNFLHISCKNNLHKLSEYYYL